MFKVNGKDLLSAVLSATIVAVLTYLSTVVDIFNVDYREILNIAFLTAVTSLLKSFSTDNEGRFLGGAKIK